MFDGKNNSSKLLKEILTSFGITCDIKENATSRDISVSYKGFSLTENFHCGWDNIPILGVIAYRIESKYKNSQKAKAIRAYIGVSY